MARVSVEPKDSSIHQTPLVTVGVGFSTFQLCHEFTTPRRILLLLHDNEEQSM